MGRILSIDYGRRRSGIAVTDPLQIIAGGLDTVETNKLLDYVVKYTQAENVERIVVGMPMQTNGLMSETVPMIRAFAARLRTKVNIPIDFHDERYTSVLAHKAMLAGGLRKMARRDKALVDKISATIILQSYMESKK